MNDRFKSWIQEVCEFVKARRGGRAGGAGQSQASFDDAIRIVEHFKLYDAVWCVECDTIFENDSAMCPSCMSSSILCLSAYLQPKEGRAEIDRTRLHLSRRHEGGLSRLGVR